MNVLVMANFRAECSGNFINSILELAKQGRIQEINTVFLFPLKDDETECDWIDYIRKEGFQVLLYSPHLSHEEMAQRLLKIIEQYEINLIHSHFSCLHTVLLWNKEIHSKVKILFHDHMDYLAEEKVWPQLKKQIKTAKRYKEYGIGVISVMKKKHKGYFVVPQRWYVPNGITFKRNVEKSLSREACRKELKLEENQKLCLFLGWDIYRKGLDIAIKSINKLREENANVILGIVGFGKDPCKDELMRIENVTGISPKQDGVLFIDSWEDMYALHRAADVYLSASRTEAFSYGILEAISQNVPVVVSDIEGTKWSWKYTKTIKFKNEDFKQCAKAIEKALGMRENESNRNDLLEKYHIEVWCKRVIDIYRKFVN